MGWFRSCIVLFEPFVSNLSGPTYKGSAKMLDRDPSSVMALLRRAEKRVLDEAFG